MGNPAVAFIWFCPVRALRVVATTNGYIKNSQVSSANKGTRIPTDHSM